MTSYLTCLEALVVLRRMDAKLNRAPPSQRRTIEIWDRINDLAAEKGIEILEASHENSLTQDGAEEIVIELAQSPHIMPKKGRSWIRPVGVMDCLHLKVASSLGASHLMTTDRCLAAMETELVMVLVGKMNEADFDVVRPAYLAVESAETE